MTPFMRKAFNLNRMADITDAYMRHKASMYVYIYKYIYG